MKVFYIILAVTTISISALNPLTVYAEGKVDRQALIVQKECASQNRDVGIKPSGELRCGSLRGSIQLQSDPKTLKKSSKEEKIATFKSLSKTNKLTSKQVKTDRFLRGSNKSDEDEDGDDTNIDNIGETMAQLSNTGGTFDPNPKAPAPEGTGCYSTYKSYVYRNVNAKWKPWHNTKNFKYVTSSGTDYYQHKRKSKRVVKTKCKRDGNNQKRVYIINHSGNKDMCQEKIPGCPSDYSWYKEIAGTTNPPICIKKISNTPCSSGTFYIP